MINVSKDFKTRTKKIKQQNIKLGIVEGELTVKQVHFMTVKEFNALPVWMLRKRQEVIAKELKYSFEGNLFKTIIKQIEITVKNAGELKDKNVNFQYGIYVNNDFEYIDLGDYYIKDVEDDKGKSELTVTGYDKMINFMKKKFKQEDLQLTYPCTMLVLVQKMCEVCDVELYSTNFFNADLNVNEDYFTSQELTYRDVLEKVAESTETTIFIKDNKLYLHKLSESPVEKLDSSYLTGLTVKEKFGPVNALVLGRGDVEDNIEAKDDASITQNGRCEIRFDENEFVEYQREQVVNEMFEQIKGLEYYAFEGSDVGVMWLEPCDLIEVEDIEESAYKTIYLKANITINTGISSDIEASIPEVTNTEYKVTTKEEKKTLKVERLAKKNEGLIQDIVEEQTDFSNKLTRVNQNIDGITEEVHRLYDFYKEIEGTNEIILEDCLPTSIVELRIKPNTVKNIIYPQTTLYPSNEIYPHKAGDGATVVFAGRTRVVSEDMIYPSKTQYPSSNLLPIGDSSTREFQFYFGEPLRVFNNVSDEFQILFNEETGICEAKIIRKIDYNDGIYTIYETPKEEIIKEITMELFKGINYVYLKEYTDWSIYAKYIFNNELNKEFAPRVESRSEVRKTADEINLEVSKKVNQNEVIASINLSPEQIKILAKNLQLEGFTSINGNFTIDEEGNMTCNDAKINGAIIANGDKFSLDEEGNMKCKSATMEDIKCSNSTMNNITCENFTIKNSTIQEGYIELKSTNGNSSFSVTDTSTDRLNSELSASLLNFNSNLDRGVAQIGVDMASGNGFISVEGNVYANNIASDERLKENILDSNINAVEMLKKIKIRSFDWKESKEHIDVGIIAQQVEKINNNFVLKKPIVNQENKVIDNKYYINELPIIATLIKAIQEQQESIEKLKEKLEGGI